MSNDMMVKPALYYLTSILLLIICGGGSPVFTQVPKTVIQQNPSDKNILLNGMGFSHAICGV
jgi:hypothetical protein